MSKCEIDSSSSSEWRAREQDTTLLVSESKKPLCSNYPVKSIACDHVSTMHGLKKKSSNLRVRSICCGDFAFHVEHISCVQELKETLCMNSPLIPDLLLVVQSGKELENSTRLCVESFSQNSPIYVLVRTSIKFKVSIDFKEQGSKSRSTIDFDLNTKIFNIKKQLYSKGLTSLKPSMQRLISGSHHVLKDEDRIGDYLLSRTCSSTSKLNSTNIRLENCLVHIWKAFDQKQDVKVEVSFPPRKNVSKFSMGVCDSIAHIRDILSRQFGMHVGGAFSLSMDQRVLDPTRTLLDYGVTAKSDVVRLLAMPIPEAEHAYFLPSFPKPSELMRASEASTTEKVIQTMSSPTSSSTLVLPSGHRPVKASNIQSIRQNDEVGGLTASSQSPGKAVSAHETKVLGESRLQAQQERVQGPQEVTRSNCLHSSLKKGFFNRKRDHSSTQLQPQTQPAKGVLLQSSKETKKNSSPLDDAGVGSGTGTGPAEDSVLLESQSRKKSGRSSSSAFTGMKKGFLL